MYQVVGCLAVFQRSSCSNLYADVMKDETAESLIDGRGCGLRRKLHVSDSKNAAATRYRRSPPLSSFCDHVKTVPVQTRSAG
jgi:hypothetical protein